MKINTHESLPKGFMKGGFFKWPLNRFVCKDCKIEFESVTGKADRCGKCRKIFVKEYLKEYRKKNKERVREIKKKSREKLKLIKSFKEED